MDRLEQQFLFSSIQYLIDKGIVPYIHLGVVDWDFSYSLIPELTAEGSYEYLLDVNYYKDTSGLSYWEVLNIAVKEGGKLLDQSTKSIVLGYCDLYIEMAKGIDELLEANMIPTVDTLLTKDSKVLFSPTLYQIELGTEDFFDDEAIFKEYVGDSWLTGYWDALSIAINVGLQLENVKKDVIKRE